MLIEVVLHLLLPSMVYYRLKLLIALLVIIWTICVNILKYALLHSWNKDYDVLVYDGFMI